MCSFLSPLPEKAVPLITPGEMGFFESLPGTQADDHIIWELKNDMLCIRWDYLEPAQPWGHPKLGAGGST